MTLAPCPYDKKPCPGTIEGCAAWGTWETGKIYDSTTGNRNPIIQEGCRVFKLSKDEMSFKPKPKPRKRKAAKK